MPRALSIALLTLLAWLPATAHGAGAKQPWPPLTGPGNLFVHYGEEHWNDHDSDLTLPQVVSQTVRYRPDLVTMSADKAQDGTVDQLEMWKKVMEPYDRAGIPYLAGIGNHDRKNPEGDGVLPSDPTNYKDVFASRPYPFGDADPYPHPQMSPRTRPPGDAPGASTYYSADYGNVRWIFLDNSCYSFRICEQVTGVNPPLPDAEGNATQMEFLRRRATEATADGKLVFVVMHMATDDPRDLTYSSNVDRRHAMTAGEQEADEFERIASELGVDGVFVAHIKGQWLYEAGGVPYYIDGGAGGELHTNGPVGTDHGYWHGFRLLRVAGGKVTTDTVPIFVKNGIRLEGPELVKPGRQAQYHAFGKQPGVPNLELRDPDPQRPASSSGVGTFVRGGGWIFVPVMLLVLGGLAFNGTLPRPRRQAVVLACAVVGTGVVGVTGASLAQQSVPTTTARENLPTPARIFTSSNPHVIAPVAGKGDDPRRNPRTQTEDGLFKARCPGRAKVSITSGFETTAKNVLVPSKRGPIARRVRPVKARDLRPRVRRTVARIRLAQPARVLVRVRRRGKTVRVLRNTCLRPGSKHLRVAWDARARRRGKLRAVKAGRYRIQVFVRSDRRTIARGATVRVRR